MIRRICDTVRLLWGIGSQPFFDVFFIGQLPPFDRVRLSTAGQRRGHNTRTADQRWITCCFLGYRIPSGILYIRRVAKTFEAGVSDIRVVAPDQLLSVPARGRSPHTACAKRWNHSVTDVPHLKLRSPVRATRLLSGHANLFQSGLTVVVQVTAQVLPPV